MSRISTTHSTLSSFRFITPFLLIASFGVRISQESNDKTCQYPSVPNHATFKTISGGVGKSQWKIKYACDSDLELFGESQRNCEHGEWKSSSMPKCLLNVARFKPATASNFIPLTSPSYAVNGKRDETQCFETISDRKSPWWTVDLMDTFSIRNIRITPNQFYTNDIENGGSNSNNNLQHAEIRVGNSSTPSSNPLCHFIVDGFENGSRESKTFACHNTNLVGRYVSVLMTGVKATLSFCQFEVFTDEAIGSDSCFSKNHNTQDSPAIVIDNKCIFYSNDNVASFRNAQRRCMSSSRHLLTEVNSQSHVEFVKSFVISQQEKKSDSDLIWVGAMKEDGKSWMWKGKSEMPINNITSWGKGQPNDFNDEQDCVVIDSDLKWLWNDVSCSISAALVCESDIIGCGNPPVPEGGVYAHDVEGNESTVEYKCREGTKSVESHTNECQSGRWKKEAENYDIKCEPIFCTTDISMSNGQVRLIDEGRHDWMSRIEYQCASGFTMNGGDKIRFCLDSGWNGTKPECVKSNCDEPKQVENADLSVETVSQSQFTFKVGSKIEYICHKGHISNARKGSLLRECLIGGIWSGTEPECTHVDCGLPQKLKHSSFKLLDRDLNGEYRSDYGSRVEFTCNPNHKISNPTSFFGSLFRAGKITNKFILKCLANGNWSTLHNPRRNTVNLVSTIQQSIPPNSECIEITCPKPSLLKGGFVISALTKREEFATSIGSVIEYKCLEGYVLSGNQFDECNSDGNWVSTESKLNVVPESRTCVFIDCGRLEQLSNGFINYLNGSTELNAVVEYVCESGFRLSFEGSSLENTRKCQKNGLWGGYHMECVPVVCQLSNEDFTVNSIVSVSASKMGGLDFNRLRGATVIRSNQINKFSNFVKTSYEVHSKLTYRCERGYILHQPAKSDVLPTVNFRTSLNRHKPQSPRIINRVCQEDGVWSDSTPQCRYVDCGQPPSLINGRIDLKLNETSFGSIAKHICDPYFNLDGVEKRTCESDGVWYPLKSPSCRETICKSMDRPSNGTMNITTIRVGGRASFSCDEGFVLKGDSSIECLSSGSWSSWRPTCVQIKCEVPEPITNGNAYLVNDTKTVGSQIEYHCSVGYERSGPFRRTCLEDSYWSGHEPTCNLPITNFSPAVKNPLLEDKSPKSDSSNRMNDGNIDQDEVGESYVGLWTGVVFGVIIVLGVLSMTLYVCVKQRMLSHLKLRGGDMNSLSTNLSRPSSLFATRPHHLSAGSTSSIIPPPFTNENMNMRFVVSSPSSVNSGGGDQYGYQSSNENGLGGLNSAFMPSAANVQQQRPLSISSYQQCLQQQQQNQMLTHRQSAIVSPHHPVNMSSNATMTCTIQRRQSQKHQLAHHLSMMEQAEQQHNNYALHNSAEVGDMYSAGGVGIKKDSSLSPIQMYSFAPPSAQSNPAGAAINYNVVSGTNHDGSTSYHSDHVRAGDPCPINNKDINNPIYDTICEDFSTNNRVNNNDSSATMNNSSLNSTNENSSASTSSTSSQHSSSASTTSAASYYNRPPNNNVLDPTNCDSQQIRRNSQNANPNATSLGQKSLKKEQLSSFRNNDPSPLLQHPTTNKCSLKSFSSPSGLETKGTVTVNGISV